MATLTRSISKRAADCFRHADGAARLLALVRGELDLIAAVAGDRTPAGRIRAGRAIEEARSLLFTLGSLSFGMRDGSDEADDAFKAGRDEGYDEGHDDGYKDGFGDGKEIGYDKAIDEMVELKKKAKAQ